MKEPKLRHVLIGAISFLIVTNVLYFTCTNVSSNEAVLIPLFSFVFALFGFMIHFGLQTIFVPRLNSVIQKWLGSAVLGFLSYYSLFTFLHKKIIWWHQYDYPENLFIMTGCFTVFLSYSLIFWIIYSERKKDMEN